MSPLRTVCGSWKSFVREWCKKNRYGFPRDRVKSFEWKHFVD